MEENRLINQVLARTLDIAKKYRLRYATLDEMFLSMLKQQEIALFLETKNMDVSSAIASIEDYLENNENNEKVSDDVPADYQPIRSSRITKVLSLAKSQSLMLARPSVTMVDVLYQVLIDDQVGEKYKKIIDAFSTSGTANLVIDHLEDYLKKPSPAILNSTVDKISPSAEEALENLIKNLSGTLGGMGLSNNSLPSSDSSKTMSKKKNKDSDSALEEFCVNLNELAQIGKIDPVVGRETEVSKIFQTLGRKNKQNVIVVGDAGTGKTAIIDGLVQKIVNNDVPEEFLNSVIYSLDMGAMLAGTKFRGEFEERLKKVISEIQQNPNVVLFIDEIHMIKGAGANSESAMDASNILKPALSSRSIRVIGATTHEEYRQYFEKDKALMRRFYKLEVNEPTADETKQILRGAIKHYESHHGLTYEKDALDYAVDLAAKYMHDKKFPDKVFDIVDCAAARMKIFEKENKIVTKKHIEKEVSFIAKIPDISEKENDLTTLKNLEKNLKTKIFGQDHVIEQVVNYVLVAKGGLREAEKPLFCGLLRGQTGCGKTELAKQLSKELGIELLRFDMSEYQEKHSVSKLIGTPPGYVGFGEGTAGDGLLINAVDKTPHCVLLLDEIEKAHPDVLNILLQVMDYGMLTSSAGKTVSFRNCIILMSSNLGAKVADKPSIGFARATEREQIQSEATNEFFAPEFRNRLDLAISFNPLDEKTMLLIVDKFILDLNKMLKDKKIKVKLSKKAKEYFVKETVGKNLGARPVAGIIAKDIKQPLSKKILFEEVSSGDLVTVDCVDGSIVLRIESPVVTA